MRIGDWTIAPALNELRRGDEVRTLKPKAMNVLVELVEASGAPVSTAHLLEACWPGRVVLDAVVHNCVAEIRAALGDDAKRPVYVRTVPRRGYAAIDTSAAAVDGEAFTLAVLPFRHFGAEPDAEYFSEGIAEEVQVSLCRSPSLMVRAWRSSYPFKNQELDLCEIADRLAVSHLVSGSVQVQGNRVRVTGRLIDVTTETDVWSDRYDFELTDVFAVQDTIAQAIVRALGLQLLDIGHRVIDVDAYKAYLRGRYHRNRHEWDAALRCFQEAVELDPAFAAAHAMVAQMFDSFAILASAPDFEGLMAQKRKHLDAALTHDPTQPLALAHNAVYLPPQVAVDTMDALVRRAPSDDDVLCAYLGLLRRLGREDMTATLSERMVALDPPGAFRLATRALDHALARRFEAAKDDCSTCETLGLAMALPRAMIALMEVDVEEVRIQCARPIEHWQEGPVWRTLDAACAAHLERDAERVATLVHSLDDQLDDLQMFVRWVIALLQGDLGSAIAFYDAALSRREPSAFLAIQDPGGFWATLFPEFFASEEYQALKRKWQLDEESIAALDIPPLPF